MRINVKSLYHSAKVAVPVIRKQGSGGVFVNISSTSAPRPRPNLVWYAASKGAASAVCNHRFNTSARIDPFKDSWEKGNVD